jgi:pimeloyl-ACP methyl ester carboxylesterase
VWLIGHSIGGLISRYVVQAEDSADRVAGVITIGTPHRGTLMAAPAIAVGLWAVSRAPLDVLPRSKVLSDLNLRPWPADIPLLSIYSPTDLLCLHPAGKVPFEDQYEHVHNLHFAGLGHTELLWNRDVIDAITAAILGRPDRRRQGATP